MVVLKGKNLGERHRELNYQVAEFLADKKNFNDIKTKEEINDVDKLYKIDIASQYKDIDYIVDILKSGDSLYISRALKCSWLYHDDYSHIINTENLHLNIFPFMSIRMKKKMLTTISTYLQNNERAANFYIYCKENEMANIALKFLIFSTEEFKLNVLKNDNDFMPYIRIINNQINLQNFVGNSFVLATTCIEMCDDWNRSNIIYNLRHLYGISNENYLDLMEKYEIIKMEKLSQYSSYSTIITIPRKRLGIRTSRDVMLKHKKRVTENPLLYVNKVNKNMLAKYSSKCEAKQYLSSLIPKCVKEFWDIHFYRAYDYVLNLIPMNERFEFMKQLFTTNYPEEAFEMSRDFYKLKYYDMMSIDQRELWALRNIDEQNEILGDGNDYIWYKFVNIDKALIGIKKYLNITPDRYKRASYVCTLVEATRDQKDLKKVLDYYYERHVNENEDNKKTFIDRVLSVHKVFELNIECWEALNKLFYSLDVYKVGRFPNKVYVAIAVVCHILHNIDFPEALIQFIELDVNYQYFRCLLEKLSTEKVDVVLKYLINLFVDKLKRFEQDAGNEILRNKFNKYVNNILSLFTCFEKTDEEFPEIVKRFLEIDSQSVKSEKRKTVTAKDLFYFLKTDATLAVDVFGHSDVNITDCRTIFKTILGKLKVYFHNDVAQEFINFLNRLIENSSVDYDSHNKINAAIFGVFQLGDESFKVSFMEKYHPLAPKIDHGTIDAKLLYVQEAICRYAGYSRPPVPLKNVLQYIKGDYVHYCIPMFNMYSVNLPLPLLIKFTESLLNAPVSIQKHGLRLAFHCFNSEGLKTLVLNAWKKSKNVSLRFIIYKSLFDKLTQLTRSESDVENAKILYEALKMFTSDINQDDHEDLFELITSCGHRRQHLSRIFIDDYLQTALHMIIKLPAKPVNIKRQVKIIKSIDDNISLVQRDFVRKNIINEHIHEILENKRLCPEESDDLQELWNAKLNLIANYTVEYSDNKELEDSLTLVRQIFKKCVEMWDDKYKETLIFQKFYFDFIRHIENKINDLWCINPKDSRSIPILKHMLDMVQEAMPFKEIYLLFWRLKLTIFLGISINVIHPELFEGDGDSKRLSQEEILSENIVKHVEQFIKELLAKRQFYPVYLSEISWLLKDKLTNCPLDINNLDIYFSQSLANIGLKETHLLTLMILPTDVPEDMKEIHARILKKIQAFEDEETQSYLHFKFMSTYNSIFTNGYNM